jgi:hypothetical protein
MEDYRCWNKHGEVGLNKAEMRDSYLEREVPSGVKDHDNDMNKLDILGFTDDDIEFEVHNIEEMVCSVKRYGDDDQYSNGELAKYKKMIKDSKKPLYHGCVAQYMRLFEMVKLFQLKASNGWSDCSFKELFKLLKDMLRREVLGDLRPILEASGIQFPNIGAVMSDEEHRSSIASTTAGGGRQHEDLQAPASGHSIEPEMIDNLAQPTAHKLCY